MAGHSKWANIKHRKANQDARRGQVFTKLARQITVAAKEGGGDPETNFKLRLAMDKARDVNMPNDNIERAINRGVGGLDGDDYQEIVYEGYGPYGVAVMLEALTDNRNRTASELRHCFSKYGGNLGESGCVNWMFEKKGLLVMEKEPVDQDELLMEALEAGADDVQTEEDVLKVLTDPSEFSQVKQTLQEAGRVFVLAEITQVPTNTVEVAEADAEKIEKLVEALEELDDIQQVYTNY